MIVISDLSRIRMTRRWPEYEATGNCQVAYRCGRLYRDRADHIFRPESTTWTPAVGTSNDAVLETEYPDLATFEKFNHAFQSDPESMKVFRGAAGIVVQGSAHDELIEEVTRPLA